MITPTSSAPTYSDVCVGNVPEVPGHALNDVYVRPFSGWPHTTNEAHCECGDVVIGEGSMGAKHRWALHAYEASLVTQTQQSTGYSDQHPIAYAIWDVLGQDSTVPDDPNSRFKALVKVLDQLGVEAEVTQTQGGS